jgi:divalent metal cation (Fe/Co/Zn/Cd) transporter
LLARFFLGLSVYIVVDAGRRLLGFGPEADESRVGMVLTAISAVVMPFLGWAKLRTATALGSGALRADATRRLRARNSH